MTRRQRQTRKRAQAYQLGVDHAEWAHAVEVVTRIQTSREAREAWADELERRGIDSTANIDLVHRLARSA